VDAPRDFWDPTHFEEIARNCRDEGMHVMLCHKAKDPKAKDAPVCQGWVRVVGCNAIGVRVAGLTGRITMEEVKDRGGPELFESFDDMLDANRIERIRR
jgi:Family of unknown function (DUF6283)